ncbi:queuosine precursor transporter [Sneathiella marina]|uniref:Probable queuosine precursor transporter n=1 Tax=Sneathiella marina TaxID=2950108 RepID=A0ABY4W4I3_9PROT|nr:queuosine precursor transporter [Sneathiella marina]USG61741.1 queuosine precursor transporter [Sneathiella marina]
MMFQKYVDEFSALNAKQKVFLFIGVIAMAIVVTASNILVEMPLNDWFTWGAISYPMAFLVTDITNRTLGVRFAREVVSVGFIAAVVMSLILADARIALASGTAFLVAQLLDITIFDKLRRQSWWKAPIASSVIASFVDTVIFFSLAFAGTGLPWHTWAMGDYAAKLIMVAVLILPFRGLIQITDPLTLSPASR